MDVSSFTFEEGSYGWSTDGYESITPNYLIRTPVGNFIVIKSEFPFSYPQILCPLHDKDCNCAPCVVYKVAEDISRVACIVHFHPSYGYKHWLGTPCCTPFQKCPANTSMDIEFEHMKI